MNIVVINGTMVKGCTYNIKEIFLSELKHDNKITEYYLPKDLPEFCCGCKTCFFKDENLCPHSQYTMPIWNSILEADLIVFTMPVYVMRAPGQVKSLLDHFGCHWMVHRPDKLMFEKRAVILTNSIGAPNGSAQKDVKTSLTWLGVSDIKTLGIGLMEGVIWDELSEKRRNKIKQKTLKLSKKYQKEKNVRKSIKIKVLFAMCKAMHKSVLKDEEVPSADNQHWIDNGWIKHNTQ